MQLAYFFFVGVPASSPAPPGVLSPDDSVPSPGGVAIPVERNAVPKNAISAKQMYFFTKNPLKRSVIYNKNCLIETKLVQLAHYSLNNP